MARTSNPGVATKNSGDPATPFLASDCNAFDTAIDSIITDYVSQTDTSAQAIASDVTFAAGKKVKADYINLNPSAVPSNTEGNTYYDSTSDELKFRNASEWRTLATLEHGTITITAGNTSANGSLNYLPHIVLLQATTDTCGKRVYVSAKSASSFTVTIDSACSQNIVFDWVTL